MPRASRSAMPASFTAFGAGEIRPPETPHALALRDEEADQPRRTEEDHQEQQHAEDDRPDLLVIVREPEAHDLDDDDADDRADQRADAAEQRVEHDLRREHDAEHVGPDEAFMERIETTGEAGDGAREREDDRLQVLDPVAQKSEPRLLLAHAGKRKPELRAREKAAQEIDQDDGREREIVEDRPLGEFIASRRHRRDRRDAVLAAQIIPSSRQAIGGIGAGERAERDEDDRRRAPAEQQKAAEQERKQEADQDRRRDHHEDRGDVEVAREQRDAVTRRAEEQRLTEAHDPGIAPDQVEADGEEREDEHARDENRQIVFENKGEDGEDDEEPDLEEWNHRKAASGG